MFLHTSSDNGLFFNGESWELGPIVNNEDLSESDYLRSTFTSRATSFCAAEIGRETFFSLSGEDAVQFQIECASDNAMRSINSRIQKPADESNVRTIVPNSLPLIDDIGTFTGHVQR